MELYPGRYLHDEDEPIVPSDVAGVILGNWQARQPGGPADTVAWHRDLLALLLAELGVGWEDEIGAVEAHERGLPMIAARLPRLYAAIQHPTTGIFEYTSLPGEEAVLKRMLPQVEEATEALRAAWRGLLCELLLLRWPEARGRTTTLRRLRKVGLAEQPENDDWMF